MQFMWCRKKNTYLGLFTKGKIYFAKQFQIGDVIDDTRFAVMDDAGNEIFLECNNQDFRFVDNVYAVWLGTGPAMEEAEPGDVFLVEDIDHEGFIHLAGDGFYRLENFEILDGVNVCHGAEVMSVETEQWETVKLMDSAMWILTEQRDQYRAPTEFRFPISDGSLVAAPRNG